MTIRRPAVLLGLAFLLSLSVACDGGGPTAPTGPPPAPVLHTLTGLVQSLAGGTLGGANVRIDAGPNAGKSTTTAGDGRYTLTDLVFAGGQITVEHADHVSQTQAITMTGGGPTTHTLNFSLLPRWVVGTWRLLSVDGKPLPWTLPEEDSGVADKVEVTAEVITTLDSGRFTMDTTLRVTNGRNVFLETIPDTGTYVVDGSTVTFSFDSDPGGEPALGTVSGNVLALDDGFVYRRD